MPFRETLSPTLSRRIKGAEKRLHKNAPLVFVKSKNVASMYDKPIDIGSSFLIIIPELTA
jgi:hypothetical protein